jgi:ribosome maturation factor RimP
VVPVPLTNQDFEEYVGRQVKIVLKNSDFVLEGVVSEVNEGSIKFHTRQAKSTIDFDVIGQIVDYNGARSNDE